MRLITNRIVALRQSINNKLTLPERFKGTFVEKWATYWRGLVNDYAEVGKGVVKESIAKPHKALFYIGTGGALYACGQRNPDEEAFHRHLRHWSNKLIMIAPPLQNPMSANYLQQLEQAINQNKLRMLSLGFCTLLWVDLFDSDDCTYPAICNYTNVSMWNFHTRIIDVGFWNQFWRLNWNMRNFDVNYL